MVDYIDITVCTGLHDTWLLKYVRASITPSYNVCTHRVTLQDTRHTRNIPASSSVIIELLSKCCVKYLNNL